METRTISIEIPAELYDAILARSTERGVSIRDEVVQTLTGALPTFPVGASAPVVAPVVDQHAVELPAAGSTV